MPNFQDLLDEEESIVEKLFIHRKIVSLIIGFLIVWPLVIFLVSFAFLKVTSSRENVTLTYWGVDQDENIYQPLIEEFHKQNPNIVVKYEKQDLKTLGNYGERLLTRISNGSGPDIFRFHNTWMIEVNSLLLPLPNDVVSQTSLESKYYPPVLQDLKVNGAYYGIPLEIDTLALFINTDIFKAASVSEYPVSWNDLIRLGRQFTVKDDTGKIKTGGVALGTYENISHATDILSLLMIQNGADMGNLTNPNTFKNAQDGLDFYTSFAKSDPVWDDTLPNSKLAFAGNQLAMYFGYHSDIIEIKRLNPSLNFVVISVPRIPNAGDMDKQSSTIASYWAEGVSVKSKHPKQAFEFLKFLSKKENLERLYKEEVKNSSFGELYPRSDMADLLKNDYLANPFLKSAKNSTSTLFTSQTYDNKVIDNLSSQMGVAIKSVISGVPSETAITTLQASINQVLNPSQSVNK